MCYAGHKERNIGRYKPKLSSKEYEELRKNHSKSISEFLTGSKFTDEHRKNIALSWKTRLPDSEKTRKLKSHFGGNNNASKKCIINGIHYDCLLHACKELSISKYILIKFIKSVDYPSYQFI